MWGTAFLQRRCFLLLCAHFNIIITLLLWVLPWLHTCPCPRHTLALCSCMRCRRLHAAVWGGGEWASEGRGIANALTARHVLLESSCHACLLASRMLQAFASLRTGAVIHSIPSKGGPRGWLTS